MLDTPGRCFNPLPANGCWFYPLSQMSLAVFWKLNLAALLHHGIKMGPGLDLDLYLQV